MFFSNSSHGFKKTLNKSDTKKLIYFNLVVYSQVKNKAKRLRNLSLKNIKNKFLNIRKF